MDTRRNILIWIIVNFIILYIAAAGFYGKSQETIFFKDISVAGGERHRQEIGGIRRGVYTVTVEFQANDNFQISCGGTGSHYPLLYAEEHWLKASKNKQEFRFWANGEIDSFYLLINQDENARTEFIWMLRILKLKGIIELRWFTAC